MPTTPTVGDCANGEVGLMLDANDGLTTCLLGLDFRNERVEFNLALGIATVDDGSVKAALDHASALRFKRRYLGNGGLEVWAKGRRISRKDAYLPENIDLAATDANYTQMIARSEAIAAQRQA